MITLNTLKITTLAVITALSLNACKSTSSTQQTAESRVSIADGNARAEAYLNDYGKKIKMAIANGDITEEEGRLKYAAVAKRVDKRMAGSKSKTADSDARAMRAKYKEASDKMTEMVKTGEITREQMEGRLNRMKKAMAGSKSKTADPDVRAMRARYKEASDKMIEMVKSGEITREQMQTRLDGMKKRMGADKSKKISKEDYDLAASKMARMVKAGEITREQMQARLDGMKKRISGDDREEASDRREEVSDDCMALRRRLGEAVRNGAMTREEAGKIWEEEGC